MNIVIERPERPLHRGGQPARREQVQNQHGQGAGDEGDDHPDKDQRHRVNHASSLRDQINKPQRPQRTEQGGERRRLVLHDRARCKKSDVDRDHHAKTRPGSQPQRRRGGQWIAQQRLQQHTADRKGRPDRHAGRHPQKPQIQFRRTLRPIPQTIRPDEQAKNHDQRQKRQSGKYGAPGAGFHRRESTATLALPGKTGDDAPVSAPMQTSPHPDQPRRQRAGILGPMRIRKKLLILHTVFSLAIGALLLLSIRPVGSEIVRMTTDHAARAAIALAIDHDAASKPGAQITRGDAKTLGITDAEAAQMMAGDIIKLRDRGEGGDRSDRDVVRIGAWDATEERFVVATSSREDTSDVIGRLYGLLIIALLVIYIVVAILIEFLVLPRLVYAPIQRLRQADRAVQEGRRDLEIIPESKIPSDELGEIMRSRNESITRLRVQERELTDAMNRLEIVASDLKQKNELIEKAQLNLADQDRLASLGVMSAGLAHEMNTPLAVLKGAVEAIIEKPDTPVPSWQAALMLRVISRLERLSDGLLDFARVREPNTATIEISPVIREAWTLVRIDRGARGVALTINIEPGTIIPGDADRLTQVFVNLFRNSVDAMQGAGRIDIDGERIERDSRRWLRISVANDGPRIDPDILPRLFEPFESTHLDDRGTGLGLAVTEGIIREHGGYIVARNLPDRGCVFEITLPLDTPNQFAVSPEPETPEDHS